MLINPLNDAFRSRKTEYSKVNRLISYSSPKEKIAKLYLLFPNKFKDFIVFDTSPMEEDGRSNFINESHRKLFFKRLYDHNKDVCIKYLKEYQPYGNCLYINKVENSKKERDFIAKLFWSTLLEINPKKSIIIFPYLKINFSQWPRSEQRRFLIFIKTIGGKEALKEFDDSIVEDAVRHERGFREWLGEQKIIPKWLDKYGNPDEVAKINFIENLFTKLDNIIIPKIISLPHNSNHPEKDARFVLLCDYAYFIAARNTINPLSWYVGLASATKLFEEWDKLIYLCKSGRNEDFALFLGTLIGTLLAMPLGLKTASLPKGKLPITQVKILLKKVSKGKINPEKIEEILHYSLILPKGKGNLTRNTKTSVKLCKRLKEDFNQAAKDFKQATKESQKIQAIKKQFSIADTAARKAQYNLSAKLYLRIAHSILQDSEKYSKLAYELKKSVLNLKLISIKNPKNLFLKKSIKELDEIASDLMKYFLTEVTPKNPEKIFAKIDAGAEQIRNSGADIAKTLSKKYKNAKSFEEKLEITDMAWYSLKQYRWASSVYKELIVRLLKSKESTHELSWKIGLVYYRLWYIKYKIESDFPENIVLIEQIKQDFNAAKNSIWRNNNEELNEMIKLFIKENYNIDIKF